MANYDNADEMIRAARARQAAQELAKQQEEEAARQHLLAGRQKTLALAHRAAEILVAKNIPYDKELEELRELSFGRKRTAVVLAGWFVRDYTHSSEAGFYTSGTTDGAVLNRAGEIVEYRQRGSVWPKRFLTVNFKALGADPRADAYLFGVDSAEASYRGRTGLIEDKIYREEQLQDMVLGLIVKHAPEQE